MSKKLKILVVGDYSSRMYAAALYNAFASMDGIEVFKFDIDSYVRNESGTILSKKVQVKFAIGPIIAGINSALIREVLDILPQIVFFYSCRFFYAKTVREIKTHNCFVANYTNDDPYGKYYPSYFWRLFKDCEKECDINYVFRKKNIAEVYDTCGKPGVMLRAYYIDSRNYPCKQNEVIRGIPDIIFLGHNESDGRKEYIEALTNIGIKVGLSKKGFWKLAENNQNIVLLDREQEDYNRYICSTKIPLVFLSRINSDTYTRRCFEIPAAGAFLMCPYTEDLGNMYKDGEEAVFFHNEEDFLCKIKYYMTHDSERKKIAEAGRKRLMNDGNEVKDRAKQIIGDYKEHGQKQKMAVLVSTSNDYVDIAEPFFDLLAVNWANIEYPIYLSVQTAEFKKKASYPFDIKILHSNSKLRWGKRIKYILDQIDEPYIFFLPEDYFPCTKVQEEYFPKLIDMMEKDRKIASIQLEGARLSHCDGVEVEEKLKVRIMGKNDMKTRFNPTIWRKEILRKWLRDWESIWGFEIQGSARARRWNYKEKVIGVTSPIIFDVYGTKDCYSAIINAKWWEDSSLDDVFVRNNVVVDLEKRGRIGKQEYESHGLGYVMSKLTIPEIIQRVVWRVMSFF